VTPAARLRAMEEKATGAPWKYSGYSIDQVGGKYDEVVAIETTTIPYMGDSSKLVLSNDDAALIVHLRNRAQLYADLIEAAAEYMKGCEHEGKHVYDGESSFDGHWYTQSCGLCDSTFKRRKDALTAALAAIEAADKEGV